MLDGEKTQGLPYDVPLDPGITHTMKLQVQTSLPGKKGNLAIVAKSLGNQSKNSSVEAEVDFAAEVRGYNVEIKVPEKIVTNKTYKGSFNIMLDVKEKVMVGIVTPPELMVIPLAQTVEVTPLKSPALPISPCWHRRAATIRLSSVSWTPRAFPCRKR